MKFEYYKMRCSTGKTLTRKSFCMVCLYCSVYNPSKWSCFSSFPSSLKSFTSPLPVWPWGQWDIPTPSEGIQR